MHMRRGKEGRKGKRKEREMGKGQGGRETGGKEK